MSTAARVLEEDRTTPRPRLRLVAETQARPPIVSFRTCTSCGERVAFVREDEAGWYACSACGHLG